MTDRACLSRNEAALTDDEIMRAACTAADSLDATRVSEMTGAGWKATTIFKGDAGLLRFGRLIEATVRAKRSERTGIALDADSILENAAIEVEGTFGRAHTLASENADRYIAQDEAIKKAARRIRAMKGRYIVTEREGKANG